MHEHAWNQVIELRDGDSVDAYGRCACGWVRHVYTYDPGKVRYETIHEVSSWTAGYLTGIEFAERRWR